MIEPSTLMVIRHQREFGCKWNCSETFSRRLWFTYKKKRLLQHMYQHDTITVNLCLWNIKVNQCCPLLVWRCIYVNLDCSCMKLIITHIIRYMISLESKQWLQEQQAACYHPVCWLNMNLWWVGMMRGMNTVIEKQRAGGCAEKCSVIIMCILQHSVSFVATSLCDLSRGKLDLCVRKNDVFF